MMTINMFTSLWNIFQECSFSKKLPNKRIKLSAKDKQQNT
jgi:hypothetical protein